MPKHKKVLRSSSIEKLKQDLLFRTADAALAYWEGRPPDDEDAESAEDGMEPVKNEKARAAKEKT